MHLSWEKASPILSNCSWPCTRACKWLDQKWWQCCGIHKQLRSSQTLYDCRTRSCLHYGRVWKCGTVSLSQEGSHAHHENNPSTQRTFKRNAETLIAAFEEVANPFEDATGCLFSMDAKDVASANAVTSLRKISEVGKQKYGAFVVEKFVKQTKSVEDPIHCCNLTVPIHVRLLRSRL